MEPFTDTVGEHILGAIQVDIEQALFEDWNQSNLDEGAEFAEFVLVVVLLVFPEDTTLPTVREVPEECV